MAEQKLLVYIACALLWVQQCAGHTAERADQPWRGRKLQQSATSSPTAAASTATSGSTVDVFQLYKASAEGGFILSGNVTLGLSSTGAVAVQKPINILPSLYVGLPPAAILQSALFDGTACVSMGLTSTGANVSGLLATYTNFTNAAVTTTAGAEIDPTQVSAVPGSAFNNTNRQQLIVQTDPTEVYLYIFYQPTNSQVLSTTNSLLNLTFQTHPAGSSVCSLSGNFTALAPATQSYAYHSNAATSAYFVARYGVEPFEIEPLKRIVTGATCLRYNLLAQDSAFEYNELDLTVLVTNETGADTLLALSGAAKADDVAIPGSTCSQTKTSWGQCSASLSNLDPNQFYWIWFISGLQNPNGAPDIANAVIEYTASNGSSCSALTLPSHSLVVAAPSPGAAVPAPAANTVSSSPPRVLAPAPAPVQSAPRPASVPSPPPVVASPPTAPASPTATPPTGLLGSFSLSG